MSASSKLRWKRTLNELKFLHEEFDLVKEIGREHATDFQLYFEDYCRKYGIDFDFLSPLIWLRSKIIPAYTAQHPEYP